MHRNPGAASGAVEVPGQLAVEAPPACTYSTFGLLASGNGYEIETSNGRSGSALQKTPPPYAPRRVWPDPSVVRSGAKVVTQRAPGRLELTGARGRAHRPSNTEGRWARVLFRPFTAPLACCGNRVLV